MSQGNGHILTVVIDIRHIWIISYTHVDKEGKIHTAHLTTEQSAESEGEIMRSKIQAFYWIAMNEFSGKIRPKKSNTLRLVIFF